MHTKNGTDVSFILCNIEWESSNAVGFFSFWVANAATIDAAFSPGRAKQQPVDDVLNMYLFLLIERNNIPP